MKRIAVVTGLAGAMVAGHERIYHRVLAKATDQAGSVGSEQPRYWPVRWSAPFLVWSPRRRHPGRVAHQHSGWALEILANPPSSRHWLAAPQRRPSAAASWGSPLPGQRLAGTAARPSKTPRMAEGSSAIHWKTKPGTERQARQRTTTSRRRLPPRLPRIVLARRVGLRWRGRLPPARTTPASSPTVRPTARAVVHSRAKAAADDSPRAPSAPPWPARSGPMAQRPPQLLGQLPP
jgi:hypothetical protein